MLHRTPFGLSFYTVQILKIKYFYYMTSGATFRPLDAVNSYLASTDVSPIRSQLKRSRKMQAGEL